MLRPRPKRLSALVGLAVFAAILSGGCTSSAERNAVARVNGETVTLDEFRSRMREYQVGNNRPLGPSEELLEFKKRVLNELVEEKMMLAEASRRKLEVSPEELDRTLKEVEHDYPSGELDETLKAKPMSKARFRERMRMKLLFEKLIAQVTKGIPLPSEDAIKRYYDTHPDDFRKEEQLHLQQIVVKTEEDGNKILEELKKDQTFESLAQTYSFTPESSQGGDLGFVNKGVMPSAIEDALAKLPIGKPSPVIATDYGFHVVRVLERKPAHQQSLDEAKPTIVRILTQADREKQLVAWREGVLSRAKIERNHVLLAEIN